MIAGSNVRSILFFFEQKTAYEVCGRDWSSVVCSSDLRGDADALDRRACDGDRVPDVVAAARPALDWKSVV